MKYFYTYKLSNNKKKFDYWKAKNGDEALGMALSKYKSINFYMGETTRYQYNENKGIIDNPPQRQDSLIEQLKDVYKSAKKMGCYDAADLIKDLIDKNKST